MRGQLLRLALTRWGSFIGSSCLWGSLAASGSLVAGAVVAGAGHISSRAAQFSIHWNCRICEHSI
eukprot:4985683-Alexandrium_andersonii.AAC.1